MILFTRRKKSRMALPILGLVFLVASFLQLMPISPSVANAAPGTQAEKVACFKKYNGVDVLKLNALDIAVYNQDCAGYCVPTAADNDGGKVSCPNPEAPSGETSQKARDAEVAPLVRLACGTAPTGEAAQAIYLRCGEKVRAIYDSCSQTGGGVTGSGQDSPENTARCATPRINAVPEATDVNTNAVLAAIREGRNAAAAIITADGIEKAKQACEEEGGTWSVENTCNPKTDEKVCQGGSLGWLLCPVIYMITGVNDGIYFIIQSQLFTDPARVAYNGPLYKTWTTFRDIANVAFVMAFIMVIYSQATGAGLSSYGVKKMLPRLLVTAILVNISFFLCQVAIDASNIVGKSLSDLIGSVTPTIQTDSWGALVAVLVGGGVVFGAGIAVVASGGFVAAATLLLPFAVTALFAALTAVVIIFARQAIIILLVAIAPLAFVAFILPNTSKYFERWRELFGTMLFLYPMVAVLFAGSKLAAAIILNTAEDKNDPFMILTGLVILFIPLFGVPLLLKFSGGLLGRIGAFVNNPNKGPFDALRKRAEGFSNYKRNDAKARLIDPHGPVDQKRFRKFRSQAWAQRRAKNSAIRASAEHRAKEAETQYTGGLLAPDDQTGASMDQQFARRVAGGSRFEAIDRRLDRMPSADEYTRVMAMGQQAADELDVKNLKAAQVVLANARVDGANLQQLMRGRDAVGMNGQVIRGSTTMQLAAAEKMMSQGRQMDEATRILAGSGDAKVRSFAVGLMQSNYSTAKQKMIGLTDETFMAQVASGQAGHGNFDNALREATVRRATQLTPTLVSSQDPNSLGHLVAAISSNGQLISVQRDAAGQVTGTRNITQEVHRATTLSLDNPQTRAAMQEGSFAHAETLRTTLVPPAGATTNNNTATQNVTVNQNPGQPLIVPTPPQPGASSNTGSVNTATGMWTPTPRSGSPRLNNPTPSAAPAAPTASTAATSSTPAATPPGYYTDARGRQTPIGVPREDAEEYHRRFGGG